MGWLTDPEDFIKDWLINFKDHILKKNQNLSAPKRRAHESVDIVQKFGNKTDWSVSKTKYM